MYKSNMKMNCNICGNIIEKLLPNYMYYCKHCFNITNTCPYKYNYNYNYNYNYKYKYVDELCKHMLERLTEINKNESDNEYLNINILLIEYQDSDFSSELVKNVNKISELCKNSIKFNVISKTLEEFVEGIVEQADIIIALDPKLNGIELTGSNTSYSVTEFMIKCKSLLMHSPYNILYYIAYNSNFINDMSFKFSSSNYFNTNSMKQLCILNGMHLNSVERIKIRDLQEGREREHDLVDYLFEITSSDNRLTPGNVSDTLLDEMDQGIYRVETYNMYFLNYIMYCCDTIKTNIKQLITQMEKK